MNMKNAMRAINNLEVVGLKRKFRPKHSLIQINRKGEIIAVYKYKEMPSEEQQLEALNRHPGTVQIPAREGTYENEQELKEAIKETMWLFDKMKR
jgi:hypothetical protein